MNPKAHFLIFITLCLIACTSFAAAACDVRFLNSSHKNEIDEDWRALIIPRTGEYQKLVVQEALNALQPLLCESVARVVFVNAENTDAIAFTNAVGHINDGNPADLIYFNNHAMPEERLQPFNVEIDGEEEDSQEINRLSAIRAVIHEAAHVADHLMDSQRRKDSYFGEEPVDAGLWSNKAVNLAKKLVENNRLKKGFHQEWERLHESFVNLGLARAYFGKDGGMDLKNARKLTGQKDKDGNPIFAKDKFGRPVYVRPAPLELVGAGFMSKYGGTQASEDIAEMTASVMMRSFVENLVSGGSSPSNEWDEAIEDFACNELRKRNEAGVPANLAAFYTKLRFLETAGFIDSKSLNYCVGKVGLDIDGPGFHRVGGGQEGKTYKTNLKGSLGFDGYTSNHVFQVDAEGPVKFGDETHNGLFRLKLSIADADDDIELASWPRGIYSLESAWSFDIHGKSVPGANQFWLTVPDAPAGTIVSMAGLVLVVNGSSELIEGSIVLQKTMRPYAPMPVPQVVPGRLTFQLKH